MQIGDLVRSNCVIYGSDKGLGIVVGFDHHPRNVQVFWPGYHETPLWDTVNRIEVIVSTGQKHENR